MAARVTKSARTGKFVSKANAKRSPGTTITQTVGGKAHGHRSAKTGRFVTEGMARRNPDSTVKE